LSGRQARTAARSAAAPPPHSHSRTNEPETQRQSLKRQRHKHTESCADVLRHRGTCEAGAAACHAPSWGKAAAQQQRGRRPHGAVHTAHCVRLIAASLPAEMVRRFDSGSILICYTKERRWDWLARLRAPAVFVLRLRARTDRESTKKGADSGCPPVPWPPKLGGVGDGKGLRMSGGKRPSTHSLEVMDPAASCPMSGLTCFSNASIFSFRLRGDRRAHASRCV